HRKATTLRAGGELQLPQPGGVLAASLWLVLATAVVTVFGIGAEIGIAGTLAFGLSAASGGWRWVMLGSAGLVAAAVLGYAVTALGAIAGPGPGSSTSARPRSSFTL